MQILREFPSCLYIICSSSAALKPRYKVRLALLINAHSNSSHVFTRRTNKHGIPTHNVTPQKVILEEEVGIF